MSCLPSVALELSLLPSILSVLLAVSLLHPWWDSEMICYPYVFEHKDDLYMLYNGNDYGKTGFGLAVLEGSL